MNNIKTSTATSTYNRLVSLLCVVLVKPLLHALHKSLYIWHSTAFDRQLSLKPRLLAQWYGLLLMSQKRKKQRYLMHVFFYVKKKVIMFKSTQWCPQYFILSIISCGIMFFFQLRWLGLNYNYDQAAAGVLFWVANNYTLIFTKIFRKAHLVEFILPCSRFQFFSYSTCYMSCVCKYVFLTLLNYSIIDMYVILY